MESFFRKETLTWITPHTGGKWGFFFSGKMETKLESMVKENAKNGSPMTEKGLKVKKP